MSKNKEKTKVLNLSLTPTEIEALKEISKDFFGTPNKSGMVRYWIKQKLRNNYNRQKSEYDNAPITYHN